MNKVVKFAMVGVLIAMSAGCSYAGVAVSGKQVVILRNDLFLFGVLRKVYVCEVTSEGLTNCETKQNP